MSVQVGRPAPDFTATAVVNGQFEQLKLSSYRGQNVVLFFWPLDFTFVCPTEIVAFHEALPKFVERNTAVLGVSVDSQYTHLAWQNTPRAAGGLGRVSFPMISDLTQEISRSYGVLIDDAGVALRGLFLIDKQGTVFVSGEHWNAVSDAVIEAGEKVRVLSVDRRILKVEKA